MSLIEHIARSEYRLRKKLVTINPALFIKLYSFGKRHFLNRYFNDIPEKRHIESSKNITLWDIDFNIPLFNSAGMFKLGYGYQVVANQGAGAFLAGTTTAVPRSGNVKNGVKHPFAPFPNSNAAINWMGLPNPGHASVAKQLATIEKQKKCPIGASLSASPEQSGLQALDSLVEGIEYYNKANVDFIEINESCPNVPSHTHSADNDGIDPTLIDRLEYISENFLKKRKRNLPVIVKLSNDTDSALIPTLLDILADLQFDGINFGNTSTQYEKYMNQIQIDERKLLYHFIKNFGGGLSGEPLKDNSLALASKAAEYAYSKIKKREFHIIRTGGISSADDIILSNSSGIRLNQWYTGYFKGFAENGHNVYKNLCEKL